MRFLWSLILTFWYISNSNAMETSIPGLHVYEKSEKRPLEKKPRVVDGTITTTSSYEWMVALSGTSKTHETSLFCGGTLIRNVNPPIVLTAAHCLTGVEEELYQKTGENFTFFANFERNNVDDNSEKYITVGWKDHMYHKFYNRTSFQNDVGVILLDSNRKIAELLASNLYTNSSTCCAEDDLVRVLGYGASGTGDSVTGYLEYADLEYVTTDICNKWFSMWTNMDTNTRENYDFSNVNWNLVVADKTYVYPGMVCAYAQTKDACQGDSGGPLLKGTQQTNPQVGVVSWGSDCAANVPGVYSNVGYYSEWIWAASACMLYNDGDTYFNETCDLLSCAETNNGNNICFDSAFNIESHNTSYPKSGVRISTTFTSLRLLGPIHSFVACIILAIWFGML